MTKIELKEDDIDVMYDSEYYSDGAVRIDPPQRLNFDRMKWGYQLKKQILDSEAIIKKLDESIDNIKGILKTSQPIQSTWQTILNELEIIRSTKYEN